MIVLGVLYEYETPVKLANAYLKMVLQAIKWESAYKPKRYGHITLYRKWIKKLPENTVWEDDVTKSLIDEILNLISSKNELLDCNMSGINRKTQQEPSPYMEIIKIAKSKNIRLVYGADVHESINVAQGYQEFLEIGD
ncbi:hypothetical protein [Companilactobacillus halodurans]|uniref:hypothetical protein n=1 Tax=Companilactobacillus halodurans TaxID=2584183 RepID=UPI001EE27D70|nr:hypothetical protein [Companilactobacillus halodurans]